MWCFDNSVFCYLGGEKCQLCSGSCFSLVNSVLNALVEQGDLDPNAEVRLLNLLCHYVVSLEPTSIGDRFYISLKESQGSGRYGWETGVLFSEC